MNLHITVDIVFKLTVVGKPVTKDNQVYLDFMATNLELQKKGEFRFKQSYKLRIKVVNITM